MSTRATYTIISAFDEQTHFYIHHDGYEEGAASYFYKMIDCSNQHGGNVERFIRANERAELIIDPAQHGDTEFHYVLKPDGVLNIYKRHMETWEMPALPKTVNLVEWINSTEKFDDCTKVITWSQHGNGKIQYTTVDAIMKNAINEIKWCNEHPNSTGNISSTLTRSEKGLSLAMAAHDDYSECGGVKRLNDCSYITASKLMPVVQTLIQINDQRFGCGQDQELREELNRKFYRAITEVVKTLDALEFINKEIKTADII